MGLRVSCVPGWSHPALPLHFFTLLYSTRTYQLGLGLMGSSLISRHLQRKRSPTHQTVPWVLISMVTWHHDFVQPWVSVAARVYREMKERGPSVSGRQLWKLGSKLGAQFCFRCLEVLHMCGTHRCLKGSGILPPGLTFPCERDPRTRSMTHKETAVCRRSIGKWENQLGEGQRVRLGHSGPGGCSHVVSGKTIGSRRYF